MNENDIDPDADLESDDCGTVLARVYEFLDHEIDGADSDRIRRHLAACEPCLETFDAEQALKALVQRCCGGDVAPDHLRLKVMSQLTRVGRTGVSQVTEVTEVKLHRR